MIVFFTGRPGTGKTYNAVQYLYRNYIRRDLEVVSNIKLDMPTQEEQDLISYHGGLDDVMQIQGDKDKKKAIFIDEVHMYANSREFNKFSMEHRWKFTQHRKFGLDFICTAQDVSMIEKYLRDLNQYWYHCTNFFNLVTVYHEYIYHEDKDRQFPVGFPHIDFFAKEGFNMYDSYEPVKPF